MYHLDSLTYVDRDSEMTCESVARTARYYAEGCLRAAQGIGGLVDSAVAPGCEHRIVAHLDSFCRKPCGIAVTLRVGDLDFPSA